jgi:hypothetical protein
VADEEGEEVNLYPLEVTGAFVEDAMTTRREKRDIKNILVTMAIGLFPSILFAWIIGRLLDLAIWKAWLWVQGIILLSDGIIGTIKYVVYRFIWRNDAVDHVSESLSSHGYPNPRKYSSREPFGNVTAEDYFYSVRDDDGIEISTRLNAAYTLGNLSASAGQGFFVSRRMDSLISEGIDKYHRIKFGGRDYSHD